MQRSLTGKEEDFETIYQDFFSAKAKKATYTFIDSTLVESMQTGILVNGGTLDNLTYRVRRAITQDWGWGTSNNCAATTRCVVDDLHLLRIQNYTAQWEDSLAYSVRVAWQYADEPGAVWVDRAKMVLRVISKNREGALVDSLVYTIDDEKERARRYKVVNLTRTCVTYDIDMYVERDKSPINQLADVTPFYFPIRTVADWTEFKNRVQTAGGNSDVYARLYADIEINKDQNNWSYFSLNGAALVTGESAETMATYLGSGNWQVVGGQVVPKMTVTDVTGIVTHPLSDFEANYTYGWTKEGSTINPTTTTEEYYEYATVNTTKLEGLFYHKSNGTIDPTLMTQTRQSSVLLSWSTDGKPIDYFRVLRRVQGQGEDAWTEVATGLTDMSYEDTSVSPLLTYEYKVEAVNDCEGRTATETNPKVGECKHTGRVEGYVRFNDGTGAPGIGVAVSYNGNTVATAETDESGYFEVDELSYQGGTDVTYSVGPAAESGVNIQPVPVTFNATSNNQTLREFTIENGRRFSGYVMYDGTSIPVKGVNFLVDGNRIHNGQGKYVETDYDGSFSFRVLIIRKA